jgi:hypothetical protein
VASCLVCWLRRGLINFLPGLVLNCNLPGWASNYDPPDLHLLSSRNFRCEMQCLVLGNTFLIKKEKKTSQWYVWELPFVQDPQQSLQFVRMGRIIRLSTGLSVLDISHKWKHKTPPWDFNIIDVLYPHFCSVSTCALHMKRVFSPQEPVSRKRFWGSFSVVVTLASPMWFQAHPFLP